MSSSHRELFPSVDEKKALEQLERFQREIQSARWKREQASAEFETFVKGFREGGDHEAPGSEAGEQPRPASPPSVVRSMRRHTPLVPPQPRAEQRPVVPRPVTAAQTSPEPAAPAAAAVPSQASASESPSYSMRLQRWRGAALVGATLIAIVLLAIGWWKNSPESNPTPQTGTIGATPAPTAQQTAAKPQRATVPPPAPATPPVAQPAATLTTTRPVWVRVMADGHRLFERELAAGATVPLDATQAIVVRAGDAGAVRLTFADGRTETLGAEGQVVTKRFELRK